MSDEPPGSQRAQAMSAPRATPARGAVLARVRDLVEFARGHGFARDEIIQMIESLP
jgi:hypothetical protein